MRVKVRRLFLRLLGMLLLCGCSSTFETQTIELRTEADSGFEQPDALDQEPDAGQADARPEPDARELCQPLGPADTQCYAEVQGQLWRGQYCRTDAGVCGCTTELDLVTRECRPIAE